jgi:hypothetical protein
VPYLGYQARSRVEVEVRGGMGAKTALMCSFEVESGFAVNLTVGREEEYKDWEMKFYRIGI